MCVRKRERENLRGTDIFMAYSTIIASKEGDKKRKRGGKQHASIAVGFLFLRVDIAGLRVFTALKGGYFFLSLSLSLSRSGI